MKAVKSGQLDVVRSLLQKYADMDAQDEVKRPRCLDSLSVEKYFRKEERFCIWPLIKAIRIFWHCFWSTGRIRKSGLRQESSSNFGQVFY